MSAVGPKRTSSDVRLKSETAITRLDRIVRVKRCNGKTLKLLSREALMRGSAVKR
jgi:hypothetical protein